MSTNLSRYFRQRRAELGLRHGEVARRMGYTSVVGAANKVVYFEQRGDIPAELFTKLATVLGIDNDTIEQLVEQDRREHLEAWAAWANEPITPHLAVRCIPAVFATCQIPPELTTTEEMEQFAQEFARKQQKKTWLVLSRKLRVYFDEDGSRRGAQEAAPGEIAGPWMRLKGSRKMFLFGGSGIVPINEPEKHGPAQG
jgi:hypothetical protein